VDHWNRLAPFEQVLLAVFLFLAFLFLALAVFSLGRDAFDGAHSPPDVFEKLERPPRIRESFSVGQSCGLRSRVAPEHW
jgi:hypothetical protein